MNQISDFANQYGRELIEAFVGSLTAYLLYSNRKQKLDNSGFPNLIKSQEDVIIRLTNEIGELKKSDSSYFTNEKKLKDIITELELKINCLKSQIDQQYNTIDAFKDFCEYVPTPMWMKYPNINSEYSKLCFINQAYEIQWNMSKKSYEEKYDNEVWPEHIATRFAEHDKEVTNYGTTIITYEEVPKCPFKKLSENNPLSNWIIWKFPIIVNNCIVGVGGIAIRIEEDKIIH